LILRRDILVFVFSFTFSHLTPFVGHQEWHPVSHSPVVFLNTFWGLVHQTVQSLDKQLCHIKKELFTILAPVTEQ